MAARCSLRFRGRDRRRGRLVGVFCFLFYLFFLYVFAGDGLGGSTRTRLSYLWRRRGSWGVRPRCSGMPLQKTSPRWGVPGSCSLSADNLSVGNCTLGACSLRVGDPFCGSSYDLMEVTVSLDGISDGGVGSAVGGKLIFLYVLLNFSTLYLEFSSLLKSSD